MPRVVKGESTHFLVVPIMPHDRKEMGTPGITLHLFLSEARVATLNLVHKYGHLPLKRLQKPPHPPTHKSSDQPLSAHHIVKASFQTRGEISSSF